MTKLRFGGLQDVQARSNGVHGEVAAQDVVIANRLSTKISEEHRNNRNNTLNDLGACSKEAVHSGEEVECNLEMNQREQICISWKLF